MIVIHKLETGTWGNSQSIAGVANGPFNHHQNHEVRNIVFPCTLRLGGSDFFAHSLGVSDFFAHLKALSLGLQFS